MKQPPADQDRTRAAIAANDLIPVASAHLTREIATGLEFSDLGPFKTLLKQFFSARPWTDDDATALATIVGEGSGWWEHELADGIRLEHGFDGGVYRLFVTGGQEPEASVFDRVFSGPVRPEATPHPQKVKFVTGGEPSPGIWHLRESGTDDARVARLFGEPDVVDVMVAGDFVTVGLVRSSSWEDRLEPLLALVTELFEHSDDATHRQSRDELLEEGRSLAIESTELHLLDPDDDAARSRLTEAMTSDDPRTRRTAVAVLSQSADDDVAASAIRRGYEDTSRIVRRTAVDAGADREQTALADVFDAALTDADAWIRWKAVRALRELGLATAERLAPLHEDADFQVRMEIEAALRED